MQPFLGTIPRSFVHLRVNSDGWPIPWFVADPTDFRVADGRKLELAIRNKACWVCGLYIPRKVATFVLGCMCVVNRLSAEPPVHEECGRESILLCPFLNQTMNRRRGGEELPPGTVPGPGIALLRQPRVTVLWKTRSFRVERTREGPLFRLGDPISIEWFREGRVATIEEVGEAFDSGLPVLEGMAKEEGETSVAMLDAWNRQARLLALATVGNMGAPIDASRLAEGKVSSGRPRRD